jgi:hypothetical protein
VIGGIAASGRGIVGAAEPDDLAGGVLDHLAAGDQIGIAQAHLAAGRKAEELLGRILHEVVALDPELAGERHRPSAGGRIFRVVDRLEAFGLPLRVIAEDDLERAQHGHPARRGPVEELAHAMLEQPDLDQIVAPGDADPSDEVADRGRRDAAAAQAGERRHARIVPATHVALAHELHQPSL